MDALVELLDNDMERIEPEVFADWKMAKTSIPMDRPYAGRLLDRMNPKFEELLDKLRSMTDIAALNGIPSGSNALLQNCLRMIQEEEDTYQAEMERKRKEKESREEDIDKVLGELRTALKAQLEEDTIIRLT